MISLDKTLLINIVDKNIKSNNLNLKIDKTGEKNKIKYKKINLESFLNESIKFDKKKTEKNFIINIFDKKIKTPKLLYKDKEENLDKIILRSFNKIYINKKIFNKGNLFFIEKSQKKKYLVDLFQMD